MSTESLIVMLDARTQKLDAKLDKTDSKLEKLDKQTNKNDASFAKLSKTASAVGGVLKKAAVAGLALATALTAVVLKSAKSERTLTVLAKTAGVTKDEFSSLAFAFKQFNVDMKGTADAMNDVKERLGEFAAAGTGPFQDFADVVGLSKTEARALANELQYLSGDAAIQLMVDKMDTANTSTAKMSFVMKSMSNDLEYASSLFSKHGEQLKSIRTLYKSATEQLKLSSGEIKNLTVAATSFDLMNASLGKSGSLISAQIAPLLNEFFASVVATVPTATQVIVDFINSFKTPAEIENITSIQHQITEEQNNLADAMARLNSLESKSLIYTGSQTGIRAAQDLKWEIEGQVELIKELKDREAELTKQRAEDAATPDAGVISATIRGGGVGTGDEIKAIADRFKTEQELLAQKLSDELVIVGDNNELKLELEQEYQDKLAEIKQAAADTDAERERSLSDLFSDVASDDVNSIDKKNSDKEKSDKAYMSAALSIGRTLGKGNEDIQRLSIVANTAAGITRQFTDLPYPAALATSAAIAISGVAQLANVGSNSISGSSSTAVTAVSPEPEQTSSLAISDTGESTSDRSQVLTIKVESDDTETARYISGILNNAKVNGDIA